MIHILEGSLLITLGVFFTYLAALSLLAATVPARPLRAATRLRRFAVIIPAHNEEIMLSRTVESLQALRYPRSLFDVIVIADNCTDATAAKARALGAIVFERQNPTLRGKGYALSWGFDHLLAEKYGYDAMIVIDADSTASENFLEVMNSYLEAGARVIQACDLVRPHPSAWNAEATRMGFLLYNYVRPLGKRVLGCTVGLRGNGMCFSAEVLRHIPWRAYSLTEDLEYGLLLLLNKIKVTFAPEATVLATTPANEKNAETQRTRWEAGRYPIIRAYGGVLLKSAIRQRSLPLLEAFLDLVTPPFVNMLTVSLLMGFITAILALFGVANAALYTLLWAGLLGLAIMHVTVGLYVAGADRSVLRACTYLPRYIMWKIVLYAKYFLHRRDEEWIRTTREQSVPHTSGGNGSH